MNCVGKTERNDSISGLVDGMLKGSVRALGKLITLIENESPGSTEALKKIFYHTGNAYVAGLTGAPGTGKSTLIDQIATSLNAQGYKVGILAIDPSSPFTGGAFLGDRIRMIRTNEEQDIYIRSMSTRGSLGGLSAATGNVIKILDAFGKDFILIETAGTGQAEVDVMNQTETTVVVAVPGLGDEIQMMKAGVMEIGDIFVVNKADKDQVDKLVEEIGKMLAMGYRSEGWVPPVIKTVATKGEGISALVQEILNHRRYLVEKGLLQNKRMERVQREILEMVKNKVSSGIISRITEVDAIPQSSLNEILSRRKDPYSLVEEIINHLGPFPRY
jgi:LAO/AO transport system kinase